MKTFSINNFYQIVDQLAADDDALAGIIKAHGYPPMWQRANTFETIIHFILEQQVSLASALAALNKLRERTLLISVENILALTDEEMRACYVSRQKMGYIRGVADAIKAGSLVLEDLPGLSDEAIKTKLVALKGIGTWTAEVYMMFVLQRADIFPAGDIAAVNALKRVRQISEKQDPQQILALAERWRPNRTIATMILWHHYLSEPIPRKRAASSR